MTHSRQAWMPQSPPSLPRLAVLWPCPQILSRYDIALVQEVRDNHLTAVGRLLDKLNQWVTVRSREAWMGEGMPLQPGPRDRDVGRSPAIDVYRWQEGPHGLPPTPTGTFVSSIQG